MSGRRCVRCDLDTEPTRLKGYRLQVDDDRTFSGVQLEVTSCPLRRGLPLGPATLAVTGSP